MSINDFQLERYFAKHEFNAKYLLGSSDPESFTVEELLNLEPGAEEGFKKHWLGYTESKGHPVLRETITSIYESVKKENILVHSGAEEAIFNFMSSVLNPGDHIIVHFPNYQSLEEVARFRGAEITRWTTRENSNWELDIDFLRRNVRYDTKAIIINCPHNPTGYLMSKEKQAEIVEIAREKNIMIFSDEVYRFLEYDKKDRLPAICDIYEHGVSIGVMSKAFSLPGLRIGWISTKNKNIFKKMEAFKDYTTICNSAPSEYLALIGLKNKDKILDRNIEIIQNNLKTLDPFFDKYKDVFSWVKPKAGAIGFPKINLDVNIEEIADDLVSKKGIMILPSTKYDYGVQNFRIGFGRKNFKEVLSIFEEYVLDSMVKLKV